MHKMRGKIEPYSMKGRLILWMAVFLLPILLILAVCMSFTTRSYERQMQAYVQQMITPFAAEMDAVLNLAMRYVAGKTVDLGVMEGGEQREKLERLQKINDLGDEISSELSVQDGIDAVFLWNGEKIWFVQNYNRSYAKNQRASLVLREKLEREDLLFEEGYQSFEADGTYYLFLAMKVEGGKIGCWFSEDSLFSGMKEADLAGLERVTLQDRDGNILYAGTDFAEDAYFQSEQQLESAPFSIVALWNHDVIFEAFYSLAKIVILCLAAVIALFASYLFFVQRSVIKPLGRLVSVIGGIKKEELGEIPVSMEDPAEVQSVFYALNDMIGEVKDLKIQVYEEQIAEQETKLQLYQLQLRPHFFLNALNSIVSFARSKDYRMVQKMTMSLAGHCRYILYHTWHVSLEEELAYTQNYVNMQKMQSGREILYHADAEEEALNSKIPILCVQIFVENALKYAGTSKEEIQISVHAGKRGKQGEERMWITIEDTGNGFSREQLTQFQTQQKNKADADHGIGIVNVRQRLKILYGSEAGIFFSNREEGGAHIEMVMPVYERKKGEGEG